MVKYAKRVGNGVGHRVGPRMEMQWLFYCGKDVYVQSTEQRNLCNSSPHPRAKTECKILGKQQVGCCSLDLEVLRNSSANRQLSQVQTSLQRCRCAKCCMKSSSPEHHEQRECAFYQPSAPSIMLIFLSISRIRSGMNTHCFPIGSMH